jgi:hypothetical protein
MNHSRLGVGRELIDSHRFKNSRQVSKYFGTLSEREHERWATTPGSDHQATAIRDCVA